MKYPKFRAASVLAHSIILDREANVDKACRLIAEASHGGAQIVALPETFIPCYPWWIWMKISNGKKGGLFKQLYNNSVEVPSKTTDALCNTAKKNNIMVVIGINELEGSTLYNTQLFINPRGEIMGKHQKLMPTGEERTVWGWGDGSTLRVYDTELGKIGGLICYEHSMPLSKYALFAMGEQVHISCWPGANCWPAAEIGKESGDQEKLHDAVIRAIAFEGQVFCIHSCSCSSEEEVNFYVELDPSNKGAISSGGGMAAIVDPLSHYIGGPITNDEGIVYADIDLEEIIVAKHIVDSVGHYARWDVANLRLNLRKNVPYCLVEEEPELEKSSESSE